MRFEASFRVFEGGCVPGSLKASRGTSDWHAVGLTILEAGNTVRTGAAYAELIPCPKAALPTAENTTASPPIR